MSVPTSYTSKCECEHVAHFDQAEGAKTPNGNPGHDYGIRFFEGYIFEVKTKGGTFRVCKDCRDDCYHE